MDLDNSLETIVHYFVIRGMTCLGHLNGVLMVNALVCIVTHRTRLRVNHDISY